MSTYPIFNNHKGEKLVYYSCPKNANSSAKLFFAKHLDIENEYYFIEDLLPRHKTKEGDELINKKHKGKKNLINIFPNYQEFEKVNIQIDKFIHIW